MNTTHTPIRFGDALMLLICAALFAGSITSCAFLRGTATSEQKIANVHNLAYAAASIGTQEALAQRPEWRSRFETAYLDLDQLLTSKTITGALLRNVIASLPVRELKSQQARIAINAVTLLYDQSLGTSVNIESQPYLLAAAGGVRDGLKAGLDASPHTEPFRRAVPAPPIPTQ
jgi:hypothetical protein